MDIFEFLFDDIYTFSSYVVKTVHGVKIHWFTGKEKIPGTTVSKEGHTDSLVE